MNVMEVSVIKSKFLCDAIDSGKFPMLKMYMSQFNREGDRFLALGGQAVYTLEDYAFNERESEELFKLGDGKIPYQSYVLDIPM